MTWKQFKEQVEAAGVKDDYEVAYIDIGSRANVVEICIYAKLDTKVHRFTVE